MTTPSVVGSIGHAGDAVTSLACSWTTHGTGAPTADNELFLMAFTHNGADTPTAVDALSGWTEIVRNFDCGGATPDAAEAYFHLWRRTASGDASDNPTIDSTGAVSTTIAVAGVEVQNFDAMDSATHVHDDDAPGTSINAGNLDPVASSDVLMLLFNGYENDVAITVANNQAGGGGAAYTVEIDVILACTGEDIGVGICSLANATGAAMDGYIERGTTGSKYHAAYLLAIVGPAGAGGAVGKVFQSPVVRVLGR